MKRQDEIDSVNPSPKKKQKKSVTISSNVEVKTFTTENPKSKKSKVNAKSKFEKQTFKKKSKSNITNDNEPLTKVEKIEKISKKLNKKKKLLSGESKDSTSKNVGAPENIETKKSSKLKKQSNKILKSWEKQNIQNKEQMEKPNWNEIKKQQKELKVKRRQQKLKELFPVYQQVMTLNEKLRLRNLSKDERRSVCEEVHSLLKGSYQQVVHTRNLSKVIQYQLKYSEPKIREEILLELKPSWSSMMISKYGKLCLVSACQHCSKEIQKGILDACNGNVIKILNSAETSQLFEKLISSYATEEQKMCFKQEFYGDLYHSTKDPNIKSLEDVFKGDPVMKTATLSAVKAHLLKILSKRLIDSTLVHMVLYEFLSNCSPEDRSEMIQIVRDMSVQLIESKWGSKAGVICVWHGTNKDRKVIMKSLKEHLNDVLRSEYGHLMLMALIDCVDDTILMNKILLVEMAKSMKEIASNEYGKKVLLYLVARRDPRFFHPTEIAYFRQGDNNATSKKPAETRQRELLDHVIDSFLGHIKQDLDFWLGSGPMQMVTFAVLGADHNRDMTPVFEDILDFVMNKNTKLKEENGTEFAAVEHPGLHIMMKKLLTSDSLLRKRNPNNSFAKTLMSKVNDEVIERWIGCNRGCFLLILALENSEDDSVEVLKKKLSGWKQELKKKKGSGASILLKKISGV